MRKITVALDDWVYVKPIDYVAARSRKKKSSPGMDEPATELVASALSSPQWDQVSEAS